MASQWITIAKIGGIAGECLFKRFREWQSARQFAPDEPDLYEPSQWPASVRAEATRLTTAITLHADEPPVLYYCRYFDPWLMGPDYLLATGGEPLIVHGDDIEILAFELGNSCPVRERLLNEVDNRDRPPEARWFAQRMLEAVDAWRNIAPNGILLVVRQVTGGSTEDADVLQSLDVTPDWL